MTVGISLLSEFRGHLRFPVRSARTRQRVGGSQGPSLASAQQRLVRPGPTSCWDRIDGTSRLEGSVYEESGINCFSCRYFNTCSAASVGSVSTESMRISGFFGDS